MINRYNQYKIEVSGGKEINMNGKVIFIRYKFI